MIAPTPDYLRVLADDVLHTVEHGYEFAPENVVVALRAAADQLEAVRQVVIDNTFQAFDGEEVVYSDLVMEIVCRADTAPQEDRNE